MELHHNGTLLELEVRCLYPTPHSPLNSLHFYVRGNDKFRIRQFI